jgi:hypothetical protein
MMSDMFTRAEDLLRVLGMLQSKSSTDGLVSDTITLIHDLLDTVLETKEELESVQSAHDELDTKVFNLEVERDGLAVDLDEVKKNIYELLSDAIKDLSRTKSAIDEDLARILNDA